MKDFYYILGTDTNCSTAEIKEAYKKLAKKFHPDLNQGDKYFESHFREINEAYETLIDPDKRSRYDKNLKKFRSKDSAYQTSTHYNQPSNSAFSKPKTGGSGRIFTISLVVVGIIFGVYLIKSFTTSKKRTVKVAPESSVISFKIRKHHKPKHILKVKTSADTSNPRLDSTRIKLVKIKPIPVINKVNDSNNRNFLYVTYVRANLTGVINMRETDNFSSDIIEKIPANSKVFVLAKGNIYYRVFFNNYVGYIPKWSLDAK